MVRLWKLGVAIYRPHRQIENIGIALDTDENVGTAGSAKYTLMVVG